MTDISLADRLAGAVWGHLVGDAVGVPYEFREPNEIGDVRFGETGTYGRPPGTWSDDGALMLALLDSLLEKGFDTTDQATRALAWFRDGSYTPDGEGRFDVGGATSRALTQFAAGTPAEQSGPTDERSGGNGSLMRILPLALVERDAPAEVLVEHAHRASKVTHGHSRPQVACALYVLVARGLVRGQDVPAADVLAESRAELRTMYESHPVGREFAEALDHLEQWPERQGRGRVWDSFWSAWGAFADAGSYRETVERAIRYGHDTDTTAAIAGGLAGIRWGLGGIPAEWLDGMRGRDIVQPLIARLLAHGGYRTGEIRVDWVDLAKVPALADAPGALGMTFLPGRRYPGRAGAHWRDLDVDVRTLRDVHGVDTLLLLVEDHELERAQVRDIATVMDHHGIELVRHPIADYGFPADLPAFRAVVGDLTAKIRAGTRVAVACMGGLGRTGTTVGCLLVGGGLGADAAIALTRETRHGTIESRAQEQFVRNWS